MDFKSRTTKITIWIIVLFFIVKLLQFVNSHVINIAIEKEGAVRILVIGFVFIFSLFVLGLITKKYSKKALPYLWIVIALVLIVVYFISKTLMLSFFFGLFYYLFISSEAQVIKRIENKLNFSRIYILIISLAISVLSFYKLEAYLYPTAIFLVESCFSFMISYTLKENKEPGAVKSYSKPPILIGLVFIAVSIIAYFFTKADTSIFEGASLITPLLLAFYTFGAAIIYLAIDSSLAKLASHKE